MNVLQALLTVRPEACLLKVEAHAEIVPHDPQVNVIKSIGKAIHAAVDKLLAIY